MVKEIERYGIPIVHMATITTISESVGANRIVPCVMIPSPVGNPNLAPEDEHKVRRELCEREVHALTVAVDKPTQFE